VNVLLVDDAEVNLRVYEKLVSWIPNVVCRSFVSSSQALEWCARTEPDLIILDYRMPPPDGLEFIAQYRAIRAGAETPIVMITSENDRDVRRRALELGASDFLNKPADPVEFLARLRNLIALSESRSKLRQRADSLAADVARATREVTDREEETIHRLMRAAEFRDNETGAHIVRMGEYAAALGAALGLSKAECRVLQLATPMHDIGKVSTPDAILLKPGPLTEQEWVIMRAHTTSGYEILKESSSRVIQLAAEIALSHHEHFDGSGYPRGLIGLAIPLSARICTIADVFDALTSKRPYKDAWTVEAAYAELARIAGSHVDPALNNIFVSIEAQIVAVKRAFPDEIAPALASSGR
jgi:response regulator RpfG family c-di-GMP phosphodiesterase